MVKCSPILSALAGVYSLLNTTSQHNGEPIPDRAYGAAPVGLLMYTKTGFMSATISATEAEFRPMNLTFPFTDDQSDHDWALAGKHSIGYAGHLSISNAFPASKTKGQLIHGPLIAANVPRWVGTKQIRNYTVHREGNRTLLQIDSQRDGGYTGQLWWLKLD